VIEAFPVQRDQRRSLAAMFRVTPRAIQRCIGLFVSARVIARARIHSSFDLVVAIETFQSGAQKTVAGHAPGEPSKVGMRTRQRPRRNLRLCQAAAQNCQSGEPQNKVRASG